MNTYASNNTQNLLRFDRNIDVYSGKFLASLSDDPEELLEMQQININTTALRPTGYSLSPLL